MNILLMGINAKYIHSNLAIYNLKACAGQYRDEIQLVEYTINEYADKILRDVCKRRPDFLAVSCYIWNMKMVKEILEDFHNIYPQVPIWLGGPEVSYDSMTFLEENPYVTGVMQGEGEQTFFEVLRSFYESAYSLSDVTGIAYRNEYNELIQNPARTLMDMDVIPFVYEELDAFQHKIIYYESSRGCPFSCSYCLSSIDKKVRFRSMKLVKKELLFFLEKGVEQVKFVDRTFNCDRKRAREIWQFMMEHDNGHTNFHFEIGADLLQEEDFQLFSKMRPGLIQLEIGVQSVNEKTIEEIRRTMDLEQLRLAVARVNAYDNIHQHLDLIAGLPFENYEQFRNSFKEVFLMQPDQLQLGFLKVLKGSYMHEMAKEYGLVYTKQPPYEVLCTKWLTYEEITTLKAVEEMVEVYYNSGQFRHTLRAVLKQYENPFDFFLNLAHYYEEKALHRVSHSRMSRYDILRDFLIKYHGEKLEIYTEWLIFDLYAREKLKNRPEWAPDLNCYKDLFYDFYKKESEEGIYLPAYRDYSYKQMSKMTHLEVFEQIDGSRQVYLFDYQKRSPKNKEALIQKVNLPIV